MSRHHARGGGHGFPQNSRRRRAKLLQLIERDGMNCWLCGIEMVLGTPENFNDNDVASIDHVRWISEDGGHGDDNLRVACRLCNSAKRRAPGPRPQPQTGQPAVVCGLPILSLQMTAR